MSDLSTLAVRAFWCAISEPLPAASTSSWVPDTVASRSEICIDVILPDGRLGQAVGELEAFELGVVAGRPPGGGYGGRDLPSASRRCGSLRCGV